MGKLLKRISCAPQYVWPKKETVKRKKKTPKYHDHIKSKKWRQFRKKIMKKRGNICECCGAKYNLTLHHLTYKNLGYEEPKDVRLLCFDCHCIEHEDKYLSMDYLSVEFRQIINN